MISIKSGTQTWSKSQQESSLDRPQNETLSASEREKHYGGKDLEEILNKAADPNWVNPAKVKRNVGNANLDKDAFLKLFLAQLKNQDPSNPMENHEMAAQLAQFTSLEKLENIDTGISDIVKANTKKEKGSYDALQLIGKAVGGDTSKIIRSDTKESHEIVFRLPAEATNGELQILDKQNQVIRSIPLAKLKAGDNQIEWNGLTEDGDAAREGEYRVVVQAKASNGKKIMAETRFEGVVTGVNYTAQGPVLLMGRKSIKLSDVKKIFEPGSLQKRGPVHQLKSTQNLAAAKTPQAANAKAPPTQSSMNEVGMARDLVNKLTKETGQSHGIN